MRYLILLSVFLFAVNVNAQNKGYLHDLQKYEKAANNLQPKPYNLQRYCEDLYSKDLVDTISDGWYYVLVTDGCGSLENYTVRVENNSIYELSWEDPHPSNLVLEEEWGLNNGVYLYDNDYYFIVYKEVN